MQDSKRESRLVALDGLRGAAALVVMFFHVVNMAAGYALLVNLGPFAVCIFFAISGYLIVGALNKDGDLKRFAVNRIARIYPVFLGLHLLIFIAGPIVDYEWMGDLTGREYATAFISNLLFLPGVFELPIAQKNAWSLSYEAAFYILAASAFAAHRQRHRVLTALVLAVALAFVIYRPGAAFFLIGIAVLAAGKWISPIVKPGLDVVAIITAYFLYTVHPYLAVLPAAYFFTAVIESSGLVGLILTWRPIVYLGKISFSLYLIHPFVLAAFRAVADRFGSPEGIVLMATAGPILAIVCAGVSYEIIEVRLTRAIFRRPKPKFSAP